jgi:hypothetical protein
LVFQENRMAWGRVLALMVLLAAPASAQPRPPEDPLADFRTSLTTAPAASALTERGTVYVPAYAAIRAGGGKTRIDLATTLGIHNTAEDKALVIERIDYFETSGRLVQKYLAQPIAVKPLGTIEIFVPRDDTRGGTGANFLVGWAAAGPIAEPLVETVMIGTVGNTSYSFVSQGRAVRPPNTK